MNADDIILSLETFIKETKCSHKDALIALGKFREGMAVDDVIEKWKAKEHKLGKKDAKKEFKRIFVMSDSIDEMLLDLKNGKEKGTTTYIEDLDNAWTWRWTEFNIWTGYANEGKSLFLRFITVIKCLMEGKKAAFYAPEDYPAKEFFDDIIHTVSGYSTDKDNDNFITVELYKKVYERLKTLLYFVYIPPPENSLLEILSEFVPLIKDEGVKICVIDPLIKVARPKEYMNADDKYAGYVTTICTDFARQYNISLNLVMHQLTPRLQENGMYPKPSMYYIKGGGTWADGTDNINSIWRPTYARDKEDDGVMFSSQKIKKQKLVGIPQDINMRFNRKTNRYINANSNEDLFNFDKKVEMPRMRLLFP